MLVQLTELRPIDKGRYSPKASIMLSKKENIFITITIFVEERKKTQAQYNTRLRSWKLLKLFGFLYSINMFKACGKLIYDVQFSNFLVLCVLFLFLEFVLFDDQLIQKERH